MRSASASATIACISAGNASAFEQDGDGVTLDFVDTAGGAAAPGTRGGGRSPADGIHSAVRKQLFPDEGAPMYSGVNMWRGATRWPKPCCPARA